MSAQRLAPASPLAATNGADHPRSAYERVWREFLAAGDLADHWRDWTAWAGSRHTHLVFLIRAGRDERVAARAAEVQAAMKPAGSLDLHPRRLLHVTVQAFGFLAENGRLTAEEVSAADVALAIGRVREALASLPSFSIRLGGVNSFYSSAFLEVWDGGELGELRLRLQAVLPRVGATDSWPDYIFHLTVALYRGGSYCAVRRALEELRALPPIELAVREVELIAVQTQAERPFPPMVSLARFPLRGESEQAAG